jgi:hypothetical protein
MRFFNRTFVAVKRPPGCVRIGERLSPDVFFLTDATSNFGRRSGVCANAAATMTTEGIK